MQKSLKKSRALLFKALQHHGKQAPCRTFCDGMLRDEPHNVWRSLKEHGHPGLMEKCVE